VMEDDGIVLFESAAICMYIARKYPAAKLLPEPGTREAALHEQWMYWVATEPEQALWSIGKHKFALPKEHRIPGMRKTALFEWSRAAKVVAAALDGRDFLVGDQFTVADIMLGHTLNWACGFEVPLDSDILEGYLDKLLERPAFLATKRLE
jgi:glutathione S-transferase